MKEGRTAFSWIITIFAILFSLFQLYTVIRPIPTMYLRTIHVWFAFTLIFFTYPLWGKKKQERFSVIGVVALLLMSAITLYILLEYTRQADMIGLPPPPLEMVLGIALIVLTIDVGRRTIGWPFTTITILTILYALFGKYLPWLLGHTDFSLARIVGSMFLTMNGIYGSLVGVSATYIYLFILFGAFLKVFGAGDFFINLAFGLTGNMRGGPAKTAVVASSLFGMISGSGMANVASVGQITIPLMKKSGYPPYFAGAVETASSTGGLIMPPIMGMSVFIMMEILGIPFIAIIKSAILIALLYYITVFRVIDIEAFRRNLKVIPKSELPDLKKTLKEGWPFVIPPLVLIFLLAVMGTSVQRAAFWSVITVPICSLLTRSTRGRWRQIPEALANGAISALPIVAVVSLAGIAMGMISLTGLGLKITSIIVGLGGSHLFAILVLGMVACLILGMGLPAVAAYIITEVLVAPALVGLGVQPFVANMFIFYFSCFAGVTPPMAPFAFVAAGISGASMMRTAMTAFRLVLPTFLVAYAFVYNPALLLMGSVWQVMFSVVTALLSVFAMSSALGGLMVIRLHLPYRLLMGAIGVVLLVPSIYLRLLGIGAFVAFYLLLSAIGRRRKITPVPS